MRQHFKRLLIATIALIALAGAAANADAAELSIAPAGGATATSLGLVTFAGSLINAKCRVVYGLTLNRLIAKTVGNQIGTITRANISECAEEIRLLTLEAGRTVGVNPATVEWPLTYQSITGTLPSNVTSILFLIRGLNYLYTIPTIFGTVNCLFEGTAGAGLAVSGSNPYSTGLFRLLGETISLKSSALNSGQCPTTLTYTGTFSLAPTQTVTRT